MSFSRVLRKSALISTLAISALSLGGCASLFGQNEREVAVNSNPQGAQVYLNSQYMGVTPTQVVLTNLWQTNVVEVKAPGHMPISRGIQSSFQPVGILNIFFWPGFIVDAISGDMMKIPGDQRSVNVTLTPVGPEGRHHHED